MNKYIMPSHLLFITDNNGKKQSVILPVKEYKHLMERLKKLRKNQLNP